MHAKSNRNLSYHSPDGTDVIPIKDPIGIYIAICKRYQKMETNNSYYRSNRGVY